MKLSHETPLKFKCETSGKITKLCTKSISFKENGAEIHLAKSSPFALRSKIHQHDIVQEIHLEKTQSENLP